MSPSFDRMYKAFEDQFRGAPETIAARLAIYRPLLDQVAGRTERESVAVDIGCGRGEWLQVVSGAGFKAIGVDLNEGMAAAARQNGFDVTLGDAVEFLKSLDSASVDVLTAFHVVEHLEIEYVLELLQESHRVLARGGLLILETPNPENLSVSTASFYLDPTHKRPVPAPLLEFMVRQSGFENAGILRLNGELVSSEGKTLEQTIHVMFSSGPDYACLALKDPSAYSSDILGPFIQSTSQPIPANFKALAETARAAESRHSQAAEAAEADRSSKFEEEIAARDAEINRLHQHIAAMENAHSELRGTLTERAAALQHQNQALAQELEGLRKAKSELEALRALDATAHAETAADVERLTVELQLFRAEQSALEEARRAEISALEIASNEQRDLQSARMATLDAHVEFLRGEHADRVSKKSELEQSLSDEAAARARLEKEGLAARERLDSLEYSIARCAEERDRHDSKLKEMKEELAKSSSEAEALKARFDHANKLWLNRLAQALSSDRSR